MNFRSLFIRALFPITVLAASQTALAEDPWIISSPVTVSEPLEVGDVLVVSGGSLVVSGVPEPGFQLSGDLIVVADGSAEFRESVIQVLSTHHGQYALIATEQGTILIDHCDYRVSNNVQHALIAHANAIVEVRDSDFSFIQLLAIGEGRLIASRLTGSFECIVQDDARMELSDIPRNPDTGYIWVWPTFTPGSQAVYSPPMPGFIPSYSFPPMEASGIGNSFQIARCEVKLWPMLVREGTDLTLQDIPEESWVVVGLHLPNSTSISELFNGLTYSQETLGLTDRTIQLINASIDTWNLYPQENAHVTVQDSIIGELLAFGGSSVEVISTTVDGSGGFFGISDEAILEAQDSILTCDVQVTGDASAVFRDCLVLPYPSDPTGAYTHFGAYDHASLHLDRTPAVSTPRLDGQGTIAVTWITDPPASPPPNGSPVTVHGWAAIYSLDPREGMRLWKLKAHRVGTHRSRLLKRGRSNVEGEILGTWRRAKEHHDYELILILRDEMRRHYESRTPVPGS